MGASGVPTPVTSAECVINVSEGRDSAVLEALVVAAGDNLLDLHSDAEHNRSVLTLGGPIGDLELAARAVAGSAVDHIDLTTHVGIHPRLGALDVVPFVALGATAHHREAWSQALAARDRFAVWAGSTLDLPCFLYGPERTLPDVRRNAFRSLDPDTGPIAPHPTAGASAVGTRLPLVAYNLWIDREPGCDRDPSVLSVARALATELRGPSVRSLGLPLSSGAQVSCNLIDATLSVADLYDQVAAGARSRDCTVVRAELVGLLPEAVLRATPRSRWDQLDLREDRTIEFRLVERGFPIGTD